MTKILSVLIASASLLTGCGAYPVNHYIHVRDHRGEHERCQSGRLIQGRCIYDHRVGGDKPTVHDHRTSQRDDERPDYKPTRPSAS